MKYSVSIRGHRTSISLEPAFWDALRNIAKSRKIAVSSLITEIDEARSTASAKGDKQQSGLSVALRLYVLEYLQQRLGE